MKKSTARKMRYLEGYLDGFTDAKNGAIQQWDKAIKNMKKVIETLKERDKK